MKKVIKGRAYKFGDNLDTDQIYPGQYLELVEAGDIGLHAMEGADPDITEAGRDRAAAWARLLSDAGLDLVITSDAKRTRETGGIIAEHLGLPTDSLPAADVAGLVDMLEFDHAEDRVLIVGHTETIPGMLELLAGALNCRFSRRNQSCNS